jgi:putrescine transport system permease protein
MARAAKRGQGDGRLRWIRRALVMPYAWLVLFFLVPFVIILKISLADPLVALPPFTPFFDWAAHGLHRVHVTLDNYLFLFEDRYYATIYLNSIKMAAISTLLCLLLGYPMAYYIAQQPERRRSRLLLAVILPFWISFLLRVYAWIGLLNQHGVINQVLQWAGLIDQPIHMIYNNFSVYLGIVYSYLPFMILPLYSTLENLDADLRDAAADLGAKPRQVFFSITLPLSLPGIVAGCLLVFIPAIGEFIIPALLGSSETLMIGRALWDEFFINRDWPVASAVSVVLLLILLAPMIWFQKTQTARADTP